MTRLRAWVPRLAVLGVLALTAAACGVLGGDQELEITADFADVRDLVPQAAVRAGDVQIGSITDIALTDDYRAHVTMTLDGHHGLPAEVEAAVDRTSLLGETYIDLRPAGDDGTLADGTHIEQTTLVSEFEDLVGSGDQTLSLVAADKLGAAIQTGATAFGGRGGLIGRFVEDVDAFVGDYEEGSDQLVRLIDTMERLAGGLADDAEANAEALTVLRDASRVLQEEDDRLIDALSDLDELAEVGERLLSEHRQEIDDAVRRLRILLAQITRVDGALSGVLTWLPRHNLHVPNGVIHEEGSGDHMAQVWLDFVVCGVDDTPGDPSRACDPPNPGERAEADRQWRSDECYDDLDACREETDEENAR